ncbi:MAG: hypothetical protein AB1807_10255 [Pseudomonadota bacterium]
MHTRFPHILLTCFTLPLALGLAGCGAGADDGEQEPPALLAGVDSGDIVDYCQVDMSRPGGGSGAGNGWVTATELLSNGLNQAATLVSHDGNRSVWDQPVALAVPAFDYRHASAQLAVAPGGAASQSMGASFVSLMPQGAVACVTQLTRIRYTPPPNFNGIPGWSGADPTLPVQLYSLAWTGYWRPDLGLGQLPGTPIDGFELVANFAPREGRAFFKLDKSRFASVQDAVVCHQAPASAAWDCAAPVVTDLGGAWQLVRANLQPGAYVLVARGG